MTRLRPAILTAFGLLGAVIATVIFASQYSLFVAFAGLMVLMHLFGHGSHNHGGSHDEHSNHSEKES